MVEKGGKRNLWVDLTGVFGEGQLHPDLRRLWSFAPLCLSVFPHAAPQDKKAGAAHDLLTLR